MLPGNIFSMRASGVAGQSYTLQFSSTLNAWTDLLTTNSTGSVFYLQDTQATNSLRFYRLKVNPKPLPGFPLVHGADDGAFEG